MNITQFTMEEVRCFRDRQTLEIRPLTFLVGENSTGKTTALACFHVLASYLRGEGIDFNADPYSMGVFKDIVRNSRPKAKTFKLGFTTDAIELVIEFSEKTGGIEPAISSLNLKFFDGEIVIKIGGDSTERRNRLVDFDKKYNYYEINCNADVLKIFHSYPLFGFLLFGSDDHLEGDAEGKTALVDYLKTHRNWDVRSRLFIFSTSPIRSRPKRTYDPTREFDDPEGSDVPMYLMRIEATEKKNWEALKTQLVEFGRNSGLFENIDVKNFGRSLGAPFQLQVKVRGPKANITDVGYGVSQILPILVQILNPSISKNVRHDPMQSFFSLLQQPEIHLHPKAQAEFSSLLVKLANEGDQSFIVETHSDYMIDRARIEIIRGNIRPEDVSLIYFEPQGRIVKVHNISFDKMANMVGVPPHYGEFFLKESKRLLGFKD